MDEATLAAQLKKNIPQEPKAEVTPKPESPPTDPAGQANIAVPLERDEMTQYKLHQHFGENYREGDEIARKQLEFIYSDVAARIGTREYPYVVAKINEFKRMLGFNNDERARYKLYQWLKLDQRRSKIEMEMENLNNG